MDQWEFQDPKLELLYHIRPYLGTSNLGSEMAIEWRIDSPIASPSWFHVASPLETLMTLMRKETTDMKPVVPKVRIR